VLSAFARMTWPEAAGWLLAINVAVFAGSLALGTTLVRMFPDRRVGLAPPPIDRWQVVWSALCVVLNTCVAFAGWLLWRAGVIVIRPDDGWRTVLDVVVLLVAMDFLMYVFHRVAHARLVFDLVHGTHHRYDRPRPLDLFVLNPFEVLGFGGLWLALLCVYPATWSGMLAYLTLNTLFGTVGHLGVEPLPRGTRGVGTSTFHAVHHAERDVNFGFYTDVWDRLFGTLRR
jgi:Delta7-sterol 5-desaturase